MNPCNKGLQPDTQSCMESQESSCLDTHGNSEALDTQAFWLSGFLAKEAAAPRKWEVSPLCIPLERG